MRKNKRWSEKEVQYLSDNYGKMTAKEIGKKLGFTEKRVWAKAYNLHLTNGPKASKEMPPKENHTFIAVTAPTKWSDFEIEVLFDYTHMGQFNLTEAFERFAKVSKRSVSSIKQMYYAKRHDDKYADKATYNIGKDKVGINTKNKIRKSDGTTSRVKSQNISLISKIKSWLKK